MAVSFSGAHPRAGGENCVDHGAKFLSDGSSPRGRGKHRRNASVGNLVGLIPARAGKTDATDKFKNTLSGSSPRGRGKR